MDSVDSERCNDGIFLSSDADADADVSNPPPFADAPILICSVPDSPAGGDDLGLGLGLSLASPMEKDKGKSPAAETADLPCGTPSPAPDAGGGRENPGSGSSAKGRKKKPRARASRRKARGSKITSTDSPPSKPGQAQGATKSKDDLDKYRYQSLDILKGSIGNPNAASRAAPGSRKLPAVANTGTRSTGAAGAQSTEEAAASSSSGNQRFPANLLDVINAFSGEPNKRFADTDILEIAAMKGIDFPPPSWWRPGGYDAQPKPKN